MNQELRALLEEASRDEAGGEARREAAVATLNALRAGGRLLWVSGALVGPDRAEDNSPFDFGSDATVGLATVMQIAGELVGGSISLLREENRYGAAALVRQLVEVEYLAWAFAEDEDEAKTWMRSSREERQRFWQPRHLRDRAKGRFRGSDYGEHCGKGGHPSPEGLHLLPDHNAPEVSVPVWWCDMTLHGLSVWNYARAAAGKLKLADGLESLEESEALLETEWIWREKDPFLGLMDALNKAIAREERPLPGAWIASSADESSGQA